MLKKIIKRDGSVEDFTPVKLMRWAQWAGKHLGDRVNWSEIVTATVASCGEQMTSQELQLALVKHCALQHDWAHNLMAGRLYSAFVHKKTFPNGIPTVKEQFDKMYSIGLMKKLDYSEEEYNQIETIIDHSQDFKYAYFQVEHIYKKYALQNRTTKIIEETPQFTFMRMATAICMNRKNRIDNIKEQYEMFSNNFINAPSPNYLNLGTPHNGLASCCLYTTDDTISSLNAGNTIAYIMTAQSAGIGGFINTRSLGDPVRSGSIVHQGKLPYFKDVAGSVTANIQAGRGGACTQYYSAFDPDAMTIAMLQNEMSPDNKRNRDIHFAVMTNKFLAKKVAAKESVFSFNTYTTPDLMKSLFSGDNDEFERIYNKYEKDENFVKKYTPAVDLITMFYNQHNEVGTHYELSIDEANRHTPFLDPIHSSNLCTEILEPTSAYENVFDLNIDDDPGYIKFKYQLQDGNVNSVQLPYTSKVQVQDQPAKQAGSLKVNEVIVNIEHHESDPFAVGLLKGAIVTEIEKVKISPEVAMCSLGGINVAHDYTDEQYENMCYQSLVMIDECIHTADYPLKHIGYTAKKRLNAAVGLIGVATYMAKRNLKYSSKKGKEELHRLAERHMYFCIKASLRLSKELGVSPWMHKTKWPQGWLPIDTYKKTVDEIVKVDLVYDWETLRQEIIENGGIRNSTLVAHMPTESSSKGAGVPNSVMPVRDLYLKKKDQNLTVDWVAVDSDIIGHQYEFAYDVPMKDMIECYAIIQKFTDQTTSADTYRDRVKNPKLYQSDLIDLFLLKTKYGVKSLYYANSKTSDTDDSTTEEKGCASGACTL